MRFYVNKLCVEIQYSFLLIIAFSMLTKAYDYLYILLFSSLHELGHLIVLYLLNGRADKLTFAYFGIGLRHKAQLTPMRELVFLCAGIFVNLLCCFLNIKQSVNLALVFINAMPIYPLDGGRVLKIILNELFKLQISDVIYKFVSAITILFIAALAFYFKSLSLALIAAYAVAYSVSNSFD